MHLLAHEFAGLRRGRLAFTLVALGALECFSFGHTYLHEKLMQDVCPGERGNRVCQLPITVPTIGRGAGESDGREEHLGTKHTTGYEGRARQKLT
jgi:hypothetical protein